MKTNEYILCAAIWCKNLESQKFLPLNCECGVVVCGWRHSSCIATLASLITISIAEIGDYQEGFVTNFNRFVGRKEAGKIAFSAGQTQKLETSLHSEDLY